MPCSKHKAFTKGIIFYAKYYIVIAGYYQKTPYMA